jgi:hypothetical protein
MVRARPASAAVDQPAALGRATDGVGTVRRKKCCLRDSRPWHMLLAMGLSFAVEHRDGYALARIRGEPTLGEFLSLIQRIGVDSVAWPSKRALFDLRGIRTLTSFTEHYAVGEEVARQLGHLHRIASLVDHDMITRASEKTARRSGVNLTVFIDEAEAIGWLLA